MCTVILKLYNYVMSLFVVYINVETWRIIVDFTGEIIWEVLGNHIIKDRRVLTAEIVVVNIQLPHIVFVQTLVHLLVC